MNFPTHIPVQFSRISVLFLIMALGVSGCSGSGEPVSGDSQSTIDLTSGGVSNDGSENGNKIEDGVSVNAPIVAEVDPDTESDNGEQLNEELDNPVTNNPVVVDPLIQNRILVTFDITVPAYKSNNLRVELVWGDKTLTAMWVGDEYWSVSSELATDTEELLTVTFYDNNGQIELASFSQAFKTGSNATETVQISVDQFNADQFDDDGDGVNNLDESIAGTDPLVDEDSLLEIKEYYSLNSSSRMSVSTSFEGALSDERPFFDTVERLPVEGGYPGTDIGEIDIDAQGNGTRTFKRSLQGTRLELDGIRTNSGSAITWEGTRYAYDGDYGHRVSFTNTVAVVDENTRSYVEEIKGSNSGTYQFSWDVSANLTGHLVEGTSLCVPVAGMATLVHRSNYWDSAGTTNTSTTVSKAIDDPYWRVVNVSAENETSEYFVRELVIFRDNFGASAELAPEFKYFICDFVDI